MRLDYLLEQLDEIHDQAAERRLDDLAHAVAALSDRYWWLRHAHQRGEHIVVLTDALTNPAAGGSTADGGSSEGAPIVLAGVARP